jgi:F-type H+-transporting ATPase subunit a
LPQLGTQSNKQIIVAQAGETGSHGAGAAGGEHGAGETHATVGHDGGHGAVHSPLAEYPALYYSLMAVIPFTLLVLIAFISTRNMTKKTPTKKQAMIERYVVWMNDFTRGAIGPGGEKFAPLVGTLFAFIFFSNLMGTLPFVINQTPSGQFATLTPAPTANLSMTLAMSLIVFLVVNYVGIKENGFGGYLKHFAGPIWWLSWLIFPIEVISALVKPISLSMRLFGNIFGEETVIAVLVGLAVSTLPAFLPIPFQFPMLVFGVFASLVQAGVYAILTCAYINLSIGEHGSHGHGDEHEHGKAHGDSHAPAPAH